MTGLPTANYDVPNSMMTHKLYNKGTNTSKHA